MKIRAFATLLALAVLPACNGDGGLPDRVLVGAWGSDREPLAATFPEGPQQVEGQVVLIFHEDGSYARQTYLYLAGDRYVTDAVEQGTYTARSGVARLTVRQRYERGAGAGVEQPAVAPVSPYTEDYQYSFTDQGLKFVSVCRDNASCLPPRFTRYTTLLLPD